MDLIKEFNKARISIINAVYEFVKENGDIDLHETEPDTAYEFVPHKVYINEDVVMVDYFLKDDFIEAMVSGEHQEDLLTSVFEDFDVEEMGYICTCIMQDGRWNRKNKNCGTHN